MKLKKKHKQKMRFRKNKQKNFRINKQNINKILIITRIIV